MWKSGRPQIISLVLVLTVFCLHLIIAPLVSLGVDEAHYALYALHPALSYFDHPPLVGWLQMLIAPLGYNEFTVRLLPAIIYALISVQLYRLTELLYPQASRWQGMVAVSLVLTAPILQLLGWGMVPDWPLILLALCIVEQTFYLLRDGQSGYRWLLLGIYFGLSGLSKYTAIFLPLGLLLVMIHYQGFRWLLSPYPWGAALLAALMISPVLVWNYENHWVSFQYQSDHARGDGWGWRSLLSMQALQMLCYTFLTYLGGILATAYALRRRCSSDWLILYFAWPFLLVTNGSSGYGEVLPNWPAMGWVLLIPLIAHWLCHCWSNVWVKVLVVGSTLISVPLIVFLYLLLAFKPISTFPFMRPVIKDLIGWQQASEKAAQLQEGYPDKELVLLVDNWSKASRVAWYAYPKPVQLLEEKQTQFDFWYGRPDHTTQGILIRDELEGPVETSIHRQGLQCRLIDQLPVVAGSTMINRFQFYLCQP